MYVVRATHNGRRISTKRFKKKWNAKRNACSLNAAGRIMKTPFNAKVIKLKPKRK